MIGLEEAQATAEALKVASGAAQVRQIRYELEARADEWKRAVEQAMEADGEAVIELVGSVSKGMRVLHDRFGFCLVIRKIERTGEVTLHMESPEQPQGWYRSYLDTSSPVVVRT